jgi:protein tyrosine phosphatase (PTP) superfamily phosphohydrolase (DUF442 family)
MTAQDVHLILNYLPISDTLATAGQPVRQQFRDIKAAGYDLVINLAMPDSPNALPDEAELVAAHGMEYVHIPVVWEKPTEDDLERFFVVMAANENRRVFVHCALNMRVSVFVYLYRVLRQSVPPDVAREAMLQIWQPDPVWSQFLRDSSARHGVSV